MWIELAGYRCRRCLREFMLREPIPHDCCLPLVLEPQPHVLDYVMLRRELPC